MQPSSRSRLLAASALAGAALLAACAAPPVPVAPAALQPPAGQHATQVLQARGVQIYECAAVAGRPGEYAWAFRAPDAELTDTAGRTLGKHYAGPTWEANDGSKVTGRIRARDAGPDPRAVPWLLLDTSAEGPAGSFSGVRSIQRLQTIGGIAPAEPCSAERATQIARVPYRAVYVLFAAAAS
ncbi:MAG: DUF3455 domain-containing protein [Piscinibacter sp.]|nr:DUF3455 domain-containing protein [Piscinibacter sp.]